MTALYGSIAVPERVFGEDLLPYFYQALKNKCDGAMILLELLKGTWNSHSDVHSWYMPDGHYAYVPVMQTVQKRVEIKELSYTPVAQFNIKTPLDKGVSNIANVVHSIDSYVLRSLVRRCNYHKGIVNHFMDISQDVKYKEVDTSLHGVERYISTNMPDISILEHISYKTIPHYPQALIEALRAICETLLVHEPFEVICIHDSFACSPVNCNYLRMHYNNILAELSNSNVICDILNQLYFTDDFINDEPKIGHIIKQGSYGIS